jgi:DNA-directed RNA polymerase
MVEWQTPLGLPVVQPYASVQKVAGQLCLLPSPHKQTNAFAPNFVHSLDSSHMMLTTLYCHRIGLTYASVHDCYWTHASTVDAMNRICRQQFIALHADHIVQRCSDYFVEKYAEDAQLVSTLDDAHRDKLRQMFETPGGDGGEFDIGEVMNSVYFFS